MAPTPFFFSDMGHSEILFLLKLVYYPKPKYNVIFIIEFSGSLNPLTYEPIISSYKFNVPT